MFCEIMRLTGEAEVKQINVKGEMKSVLNNRVAISDASGNTTFVDMTAWGGTAELIGQFLHKGDEFYGEGVLKNKGIKLGEKEIQTIYLRLEKIKFTYGNKRREGSHEEIEELTT